MLNQVVLVGRLKETPKLEKLEKNEYAKITLAVPRSYKNDEGEYDTDLIPCALWNDIAKNTVEYCKKGDLVGVKGAIQVNDKIMIVRAEKITFLSTKKGTE